MMKCSHSNVRVLFSHLCAMAIGALAVLQWEAIVMTQSASNEADRIPTADPLPMDHQRQARYGLLPVLVMEKPPKSPIQLHKLLLDFQPRISLPRKNNLHIANATSSTSISICPLHGFSPSSKHGVWHTWLENGATDLLKDTSFIRWAPVTNTTDRRSILYSSTFWQRLSTIADKVLMLSEGGVLCGNPTSSLLDFIQNFGHTGD